MSETPMSSEKSREHDTEIEQAGFTGREEWSVAANNKQRTAEERETYQRVSDFEFP